MLALITFALGVCFAADAFAGLAGGGDAADLAPVSDRVAVSAKLPPVPANRGGAKVPVLRFPQTLSDSPTAVLHDNGPLVTHTGGGFGGADASRLQTGLLMNTIGFGHQVVADNHMADDFTITDPGGWQIDTISFFAYQTGSTTTSTINDVRVQIWDGPPNGGGVVVFGDLTTNRLASTAFTNIYRDTETAPLANNRPIMVVVANIGTTLGPGTYWVEWEEGGTLASGPWAPPVTIVGLTLTGNGLQFIGGTATWGPANDTGTATQQDLPFVIEGSVLGGASIALTKTVGTVPAVCAATDAVTVATGTTVYYCFHVENTGVVAFNFHDLVDDHLGTLLTNEPISLPPGGTYDHIVSNTAMATVTNTATWTAADSAGGFAVDDTILYDFEDISATGTAVALSDDQVSGALAMGFTFDYFGVNYTDAYISSNGFLTLLAGQSNGCCTGLAIPSAGSPDAVIAAWWEDLNPALGGTVHYETLGVAPNRRFIAQYTNVQHFGGGNPVTMQAKLFEGTNVIEVHYQAAPADGGTHSAGVENETGTVGVQYALQGTGLTTPLAVQYTPATAVTASASDSATVTIADPDIVVTPASLSSTLDEGQTDVQQLDIQNIGVGDLDWTLEEAPPVPVSIPASDGSFQRGKFPDSAGPAPSDVLRSMPAVTGPGLVLGVNNAYSWNSNGEYYTVFDITDPTVLPNVAGFPASPDFIGAGEYVDGLVYMVDTVNNMWEVDPVTGAILDTFTATAPTGGETYSGMALDPTSGIVYAAATSCSASSLYTLDVLTGTATLIGPATNAACLIALAVDGNGDLWGYDIIADMLVSIDKTTGAGVVIGSIGFDANFGQGMGWDPATDTLLMAAFNNGSFQGELRSVDRTSGNTTLVGVLGSTTPGGSNQLSWLGLEIGLGPCSNPSDLGWVSVNPTSGTTPPSQTTTVDVTFDSTGLAGGTYDGFLCIQSNDPDERLVEVPVTLTVNDTMPFIDGFETGDASRWSASVGLP